MIDGSIAIDTGLTCRMRSLARTLANGPSGAFSAIKDNLELASSADFIVSLDHEAENMATTSSTAQHAEAVRAFIEKRAPNFGYERMSHD